ncbi:MAG: response regulator transcription factor [Christensenellaceae bacterium]|jgi:DNA-binding response OmpR family regulator|nr:response regulator transcription factor [Christensenellaceae bacterium]
MKTILCVEDERHILDNNRKALEDAGYAVLTAENLAGARSHLAKYTPDAIVLDIMLPDGLGLDLLCEMRESGSSIPVLLLTAWGKPSDIARGLRAGANDYVSKPFEYEVLLARIETMLRGAERMPETISKGSLTLKLLSMIALLNGEDIHLTQKEFALILLFAQNEGKIISADRLYKKVWDTAAAGDMNALKKQISNLRIKIEGSGFVINSIRGIGYIFERKQ